MASKADIKALAARLSAGFAERDAIPVEADILLPSKTLLDLYGEDIRARAYVTSDPLRGEHMLRPDFTVPVTQMHLASGRTEARYCYAGEVFRQQEDDATRASEYVQVGFEIFGGADPAAAEAEVFAALSDALPDLPLRAAMGDIGILIAAVAGLDTPDRRKAALMRHIWRPGRFRSLIDRFSHAAPEAPEVLSGQVHVGLRSQDEIAERIAALRAEADTAPLTASEAARLDAIFSIRDTADKAARRLRAEAAGDSTLLAAADRFEARLQALSERGVDVAALDFEASFGRTTLEYYDGFVFGLSAPGREDLPPVATGGRYDALTSVLGQGTAVPAVGGVIRPDLALALAGGVSQWQ